MLHDSFSLGGKTRKPSARSGAEGFFRGATLIGCRQGNHLLRVRDQLQSAAPIPWALITVPLRQSLLSYRLRFEAPESIQLRRRHRALTLPRLSVPRLKPTTLVRRLCRYSIIKLSITHWRSHCQLLPSQPGPSTPGTLLIGVEQHGCTANPGFSSPHGVEVWQTGMRCQSAAA